MLVRKANREDPENAFTFILDQNIKHSSITEAMCFCLFVWFVSLHCTVNNFSVISGWVEPLQY